MSASSNEDPRLRELRCRFIFEEFDRAQGRFLLALGSVTSFEENWVAIEDWSRANKAAPGIALERAKQVLRRLPRPK